MLATLGACQEYGLPLLTVVLNNGGYGAIRGGLRRYRPDGWAVKHDDYLGADFTPLPEYAALAAAYGAQGYRVARPEEMDKTLPQAFAKLAAGQSVIIDAVVD